MPPGEWQAVYYLEAEPFYFLLPLAAWALVQQLAGDEWSTAVVGLDGFEHLSRCDYTDNFAGYQLGTYVSVGMEAIYVEDSKQHYALAEKPRRKQS